MSNAFPMAVELLLLSSIWPKTPDMVLCMVSIMVRMLCMISIISGNWVSSCGMITSNLIEVCYQIAQLIGNLVNTVDVNQIWISATSRWEYRSSAFPSRSNCGSASRNPRNPQCDLATRS